ncbi:hypothetical protein CFOL_v3_02706, partial [Cephalotus follicularis]
NPFVGDPHVVLGQVYLTKGWFEDDWRRLWIAWARILLMKAKEKSWP